MVIKVSWRLGLDKGLKTKGRIASGTKPRGGSCVSVIGMERNGTELRLPLCGRRWSSHLRVVGASAQVAHVS